MTSRIGVNGFEVSERHLGFEELSVWSTRKPKPGERLIRLEQNVQYNSTGLKMATREDNGHLFDFDTEVCTKCRMSLEAYEDNGKPLCRGLAPFEQTVMERERQRETELYGESNPRTEGDRELEELRREEPVEPSYDEL